MCQCRPLSAWFHAGLAYKAYVNGEVIGDDQPSTARSFLVEDAHIGAYNVRDSPMSLVRNVPKTQTLQVTIVLGRKRDLESGATFESLAQASAFAVVSPAGYGNESPTWMRTPRCCGARRCRTRQHLVIACRPEQDCEQLRRLVHGMQARDIHPFFAVGLTLCANDYFNDYTLCLGSGRAVSIACGGVQRAGCGLWLQRSARGTQHMQGILATLGCNSTSPRRKMRNRM